MWVEAIITRDDFAALLHQCVPLKIRIGEDGDFTLDSISEVSLVPDKGLHVVCAATLHWPVLGIHVPATLRSLSVSLMPVIEKRAGGDVLLFKPHVDHADVALVPTMIDNSITAKINAEIESKELAWGFAKTLSYTFKLPESLESIQALALAVAWGQVRVTEEALVLAVSFQSTVERSNGPREHAAASADAASSSSGDAAPTSADGAAPMVRARSDSPPAAWRVNPEALSRQLTVAAGVAAFALTGAFALGRAMGRRAVVLRWPRV